MRPRYGLAGLAFVLPAVIALAAAAPARAAICMHKSMSQDEIVAAINAQRGCDNAMKLFQDCEYGASGDVPLGAAVEKKCEADFRLSLGVSQKKAYQHEMQVCDRKYRNQSGTMYVSFTAFCRAQVAQRYSQKARKTGR